MATKRTEVKDFKIVTGKELLQKAKELEKKRIKEGRPKDLLTAEDIYYGNYKK